MSEIKPPGVAGIFYPENPNELIGLIKTFYSSYEFQTRAVIAPHAGYIYSGELAMRAISYLNRNLTTIFIFAPAHRVYFEGIALSGYKYWDTPLGKLELNSEICAELELNFHCRINNMAFEKEHSIEVHLPFIKTLFSNVKIVPVLMGNNASVEDIIEKYYSNEFCGFIFSSDLSHYLNYRDCIKADLVTANIIETNESLKLKSNMACGAAGIMGLLNFAGKKNYNLIRLGLKNSADAAKDKNRVVGYGAWGLFEGEKNEFIKKYYSNYVINLCKTSIKNQLLNQKDEFSGYPAVFDQPGASFVTINKQNALRGCIGSVVAHRPLINDLISNSIASAFYDSRFLPVQIGELEELDFAISLLGSIRRIDFLNEEELLSKIQKDIDGIIIKDNGHQAVYLPSVWKQLDDKKLFLNSLKVKAGLSSSHFSKTFEAYKFKVEYIN